METKNQGGSVSKKINFEEILNHLEQLKKHKVLVIGDTILDHYVFVSPKGRAVKDPILSVGYISDELYAGGILAIANHVSTFVDKVKLVTLIGDINPKLDFIRQSLRDNVELMTFVKENSPTIIKKRFVDYYRKNKLFKVEYMEDSPLSEDRTREIVEYLDGEVTHYDLVIVGDFGHGFINDSIRRKLEEKSKFLAINVQSNSANMGYNYVNLYHKMDFISMDEQEFRLFLCRRFEKIEAVIEEARTKLNYNSFLITRGSNGTVFVNNNTILKGLILTNSVKDASGIAVNIVGNKEFITKEGLINFITNVLELKNGVA